MTDVRSQVALALSILVGLFFIEFPPLFLLGYWSWGPTIHKILTGAFLIANLVIAQFVTRRLGFLRRERGGSQKPLPGT
jgi:hypothetical protein